MHVGVTNMELNLRVDRMTQEIEVHLGIEVAGTDDAHFMERVNAAMIERDAQMLLLTLLEASSGHAYRRGEELEPGERTPNDPNFQSLQTGRRMLDITSDGE